MSENGTLRTLRELSAPSVMGAFTGFRVGLAWAESWAQGAPELTRIGLEMWNPKSDPDAVAGEYRDKFMQTYECSVGAALKEVDEGTDQVRGYLPKQDPAS